MRELETLLFLLTTLESKEKNDKNIQLINVQLDY